MVRTPYPSETLPRDESRASLTLGGDLPAAHDARDGHARRGGRAGGAGGMLARAEGRGPGGADGALQLTPPPGRQSAGPGEPYRRITLAAHEARGDRRALSRVRVRPPAAGPARWSFYDEFCSPSPCGRPTRNSTSTARTLWREGARRRRSATRRARGGRSRRPADRSRGTERNSRPGRRSTRRRRTRAAVLARARGARRARRRGPRAGPAARPRRRRR